MTQHRALCDARGAARVLQKRDIRKAEFDVIQLLPGAGPQRCAQADAAGQGK